MNGLALALALASATFFGLSSALQQRAAKQERPRVALDPRLLIRLLRRPLWLFSWLPDGTATALQTLALHYGPLALVQPLLVTGLFVAIPLEAAFNRTRPQARDLIAVAIGVIGLAAFLVAADPRAGVPNPSMTAWLGVGVASGAVVAACLGLAAHVKDAARGTLLGIATGLLFALTASLLKALTSVIAPDPLNALTHWYLYALIVVGIAGLLLNQNAFQSGPIAAPLTALTLVDPVASVAIAVTAFRETLSVDLPHLVIELVGAAAMIGGIWLASTRHRHART